MECVFYGIGSAYVYEVQETVQRLGWRVHAYVRNQTQGAVPARLRPVIDKADVVESVRSLPVVFPLITPGFRQLLEQEAIDGGWREFASVIDPTAIVAASASFGAGALINSGALVGANCVASRFVVLNRGASVGHDVQLERFVSIGPGAIICGGCRIEAGAFVGAGAIVNPETRVGRNCVVGAGAVVTRDVPDECLVVGNPARVVHTAIRGYNGVSVV